MEGGEALRKSGAVVESVGRSVGDCGGVCLWRVVRVFCNWWRVAARRTFDSTLLHCK
jgi:hypothetical protein